MVFSGIDIRWGMKIKWPLLLSMVGGWLTVVVFKQSADVELYIYIYICICIFTYLYNSCNPTTDYTAINWCTPAHQP